MPTYSFLDNALSISGPNINATIGGDGTASAEEGFTVVFEEEADIMTPGADGEVMHSLTAATRGRIELHLLKTSSYNAVLSACYSQDRSAGSQQWAKNTLSVRNPVSGDTYSAIEGAIRKFPDNTYGTRGNTLTWVFNCSKIDPALGNLTP